MTIVAVSLLIVVLICLVVLIVIVILKKNNVTVEGVGKTDLDLLQSQLSELNTKSGAELKEYINEINGKSDAKLTDFESSLKQLVNDKTQKNSDDLNAVERQVKEWIDKQIVETKSKMDHSSTELRQLLGSIKEQALPIKDVKDKVFKLDNLLSQNNKVGKAGEYFLERIFNNLAGISKNDNLLFERQYRLLKKTDDGKGLIADLFIKGDGSKFINIPIDAKFPFNSYQALADLELTSDEYKKHEKTLKENIKTRIEETSKYVSAEDNTVYSIMFVPSEGIFSYICDKMTELIDYAFGKKVIIAGPSTLVAILSSVEQYMKLFENISQYDKKVDALNKTLKYVENYDEEMSKLFLSIEKLHQQYNEMKTKERSLKKQFSNLVRESES